MSNQFTLEDLKRIIRKIEFNKTPSELLIRLIAKATERGNELREDIKKIRKSVAKIAEELLLNGLIKKLEISDIDNFRKKFSAGIDGSRQLVGGKTGKYYLMLDAVIVKFPEGIFGPIDVKYSDVDILPIFDPSGNTVNSLSEDLMLELETKAIRRFINREVPSTVKESYLILDGPIVDPPRPPLGGDESYIDLRAFSIREGLIASNKVYTLGYVKKVSGSIFKSYVEENLNRKFDGFNYDLDFVGSCLIYLLSTVAPLESKNNIIYYTVPIELPHDLSDSFSKTYSMYRNCNLYVFYTYSMLGGKTSIFRLDIAFDRYPTEAELLKRTEDALKIIYSSTLPGMRHPIQIIIAHNKANIRKGAAEILFQEIMTRGIVLKDANDNITLKLKNFLIED
mgnify:CR=1 FL=1